MNQQSVKIFASKRSQDDTHLPEEIVASVDELYSDLEYGDVLEGEYQIWEYPSGKIFAIQPDRKVDDKHYYALPSSDLWWPKLVEITADPGKVKEAYQLLDSKTSSSIWQRLVARLRIKK